MDIKGLDYNTQREKLVLSEYGREIQKMAKSTIFCISRPYSDSTDVKYRRWWT